jgi:uncharacterized protein YcsI (UPF0317 family)
MSALPAVPAATPALPAALARAARLRIRSGHHTGFTSGMAEGHVQGNVVILPAPLAADFRRFCELNPKPCPLIGVSGPGDPALPMLGADIDIRTDVPAYRVYRHGRLDGEPTDIRDLWRNDLVTFVIGCSFSFEWPLIEAGLRVRHIEQGCNVPMYRTGIETAPAGPFHGPLVVSMRPFRPADAIRAIEVSAGFPAVHGAPVHFGDPAAIGIRDIDHPEYGDAVEIRPGEVPVFWACGVTPQAVIAEAKPSFCITHKPGCMLITDLLNSDLRAP